MKINFGGIIVYQDQEDKKIYFLEATPINTNADLDEKNLKEITIEDLTKGLAFKCGAHPERIEVDCWIPTVLPNGKRVAASYERNNELTETLRESVKDYIDSGRNPEATIRALNVRDAEESLDIKPEIIEDVLKKLL